MVTFQKGYNSCKKMFSTLMSAPRRSPKKVVLVGGSFCFVSSSVCNGIWKDF